MAKKNEKVGVQNALLMLGLIAIVFYLGSEQAFGHYPLLPFELLYALAILGAVRLGGFGWGVALAFSVMGTLINAYKCNVMQPRQIISLSIVNALSFVALLFLAWDFKKNRN